MRQVRFDVASDDGVLAGDARRARDCAVVASAWHSRARSNWGLAAFITAVGALAGPAAASGVRPTEVKPPLVVMISLERQRLEVYAGDDLVVASKISSGRAGHRTPTGVFSVLQKNRHHFSNLYNGAPMPFMQRLTWSGIALHAGQLPGYPASHGCIRLPRDVASRLFGMTGLSTRVIVTQGALKPRTISHPALFAPLPEAAPEDAGRALTPRATLIAARGDEAVGEQGTAARRQEMRTMAAVRAARAAHRATLDRAIAEAEVRRAGVLATRDGVAADVEAARGALKSIVMALTAIERELARSERAAAGAREALARTHGPATIEAALSDQQAETMALREEQMEQSLLEREQEIALLVHERELGLRERAAAAERLSGFEARLGERNSEAAAATAALADARQALKAFDRAEAVREKPLSIFVSAKTETVEIRQGFTVIHEAPVTIAANGARLGTHVLTAVANSGTAAKPKLTWSVVSLGGGGLVAPTPAQGKARELRRGRVREEVSRVLNAEAALAAVTFAQPTRDLIEELIRPGASLTLSDLAPSRETGLYTDVILATR